ncbi:deoxyribose-phosphate aldolase [Spirochaetia bacterium 38H-sp]|uniref:Deoxyribose-phosphate aldolase n=1 Tax=Rarispira pelagica TaxID=3141764 RepID=A0ABU9UD28_9SPIR
MVDYDKPDKKELASYIDHTLLKPFATQKEIKKLCEEAVEYFFASVCVNPVWVPYCASFLKGSDVRVCTVIGFPLGANISDVKRRETEIAVSQGAREVDMVINIGALKQGDYNLVRDDIGAVVGSSGDALVKVIIETCFLTDEEKVTACILAEEAGADYVKTSTGFGTSGASKEDVALMRKTVGNRLGVKASGGIRSLEDALDMIRAGSSRLGTSSGVNIISSL